MTLRFELSFAVGAIVALLHDVIITVGVFALLGRELTQGRENETPFRPASPLPDPQNIFFSPTGHNLRYDLKLWIAGLFEGAAYLPA